MLICASEPNAAEHKTNSVLFEASSDRPCSRNRRAAVVG